MRMSSRQTHGLLLVLLVLLLGACEAADMAQSGPDVDSDFADLAFEPAPACEQDEALSEEVTTSDIEALGDTTGADLLARHAVVFRQTLPYDPAGAAHLDLIQQSALALDSEELGRLQDRGFVILPRIEFPTFAYGYETLYSADLPVYITADSVLFAIHRSYDAILETVESDALVGELATLLFALRERLAGGAAAGLPAASQQDVDLYLAVATSLLIDQPAPPVAGGEQARVAELIALAKKAAGVSKVALFGDQRDVDWSQFKPRGHYQSSAILSRYFRTIRWLGRIDFRLLVPRSAFDPTLVLKRRQLEAAVALRSLFNSAVASHFSRIDGAITAFVGEPDAMTLGDVDRLLQDLDLQAPADLAQVEDETLERVLREGDYGVQRIASHLLEGGAQATGPLPRSFALFPQRYTVDSHVLSNVVYDRVMPQSAPFRLMPDPLDVAFAALANDHAAALLDTELETYQYAPELGAIRMLVDAHGCDYWGASLYGRWLSALRTLSPRAGSGRPQAGLPQVAATEPWTRRLLNTQLASWAELRHDTIAYAKQSYTSDLGCEFPDAYVEPYPEFFAAVGRYAVRGRRLADDLVWAEQSAGVGDALRGYFDELARVAGLLGDMAQRQRDGEPLTAEQLAFINDVVRMGQNCTPPADVQGWYHHLLFHATDASELSPTIADVHTQPTDETGKVVGKVLHVATGTPRPMVVTVDVCGEPRAYVGLVSSYYELVTTDFERRDDETWRVQLEMGEEPGPPAWLGDLWP